MSLHVGLLKDVMTQAYYALGDNMMRTLLSIVGIAIGIAAVMTVGSVSQSLEGYIYEELETYGLRSIWVYRDWGDDEPNKSVRQGSGISNDDYMKINGGCCSAVVRATPIVYSEDPTMQVRVGNEYYDATMEGVGIHYLDINSNKLKYGHNFRRDDILRRKPVAIIGPSVVKALFGNAEMVKGKTFRFNKQKYTIIGVLDEIKRDLLTQVGADDYDVNGRVLIPYTAYQSVFGVKDVHTVQAEARSLEENNMATKQIVSLLKRSHNDRYEYKTETMDQWIETADGILWTISLLGLTGALIALVVGGIGIMNIMSTSVVERTREIGVRKAIGAQSQDILVQFLMEAMFVSTLGGIVGLVLGIMAGGVIGLVSGYTIIPSWSMAFISIAVSMLAGIASGFYPALRASKLKPVEALRYE